VALHEVADRDPGLRGRLLCEAEQDAATATRVPDVETAPPSRASASSTPRTARLVALQTGTSPS